MHTYMDHKLYLEPACRLPPLNWLLVGCRKKPDFDPFLKIVNFTVITNDIHHQYTAQRIS